MKKYSRNIKLAALFVCMFALTSTAYAQKSKYNGWDHIATKLIEDGIPSGMVMNVYSSGQIPPFKSVTFRLNPAEGTQMYSKFDTSANIQKAKRFLKQYHDTLEAAENIYGVSRNIIAAILLIETNFGKNTGNQPILYRLSRLANICDEKNIDVNYLVLRKSHPGLERKEVFDRAIDLHAIFYPEVKATFEVARRNDINPLSIKGSHAGAFGFPQFLPSSYLKYGVDGNRDGRISLYNMQDTIHSVANYLSGFGWEPDDDEAAHKRVIWEYNHSEPYVDTVYGIYSRLENSRG